jgi:hypothetical protein
MRCGTCQRWRRLTSPLRIRANKIASRRANDLAYDAKWEFGVAKGYAMGLPVVLWKGSLKKEVSDRCPSF